MHVIRLHGPWEYEPLSRSVWSDVGELSAAAEPLPSSGRTTLPANGSELPALFRGQVRYTRRFHRPTGLNDGQRVFLAIEAKNAAGAVLLNGASLGAIAPSGGLSRFDVGDRMTRVNELAIEMETPPGVIAAVRLEIEE